MAAIPYSASFPVPASPVSVPWERIEQFIGQFTHDIRNGLNAIELQLTFLGEISTDPEAAEEVKRLRASLLDLTRQLQAMRIATGAITLHLLDYPAGDFIEDLRQRFDRRHAEAAARMQWNVDVGDLVLALDPELSISAVLAMLLNASHFATPGTPVVVQAGAGQNGMSFVIQEQSPNLPTVPPEEWGRTPLQSGRRGAYGLGLFRARRIIEAQGGTLDASYSAADGSVVTTLILPAARPDDQVH